MKTPEQRKAVYEILEKEGKTDLLEGTKEYVKTYEDVDAKLRQANEKLQVFGDMKPEELKDMQNAAAIMEELGGKDEVNRIVAKAEGLEEESEEFKTRIKELEESNSATVEKLESKLSQMELRNLFRESMTGHLKEEAMGDVTQLAILRGEAKRSESGQLLLKDGEEWKGLGSGGADVLKEKYGWAVKEVGGSGDGTGDNRGSGDGGGAPDKKMKEIMGINEE